MDAFVAPGPRLTITTPGRRVRRPSAQAMKPAPLSWRQGTPSISGSSSKAATVLGIAQPALGRQIQKLEEECGVRLFYRHGRGVSPTPEGETLLERARPLVRQLASIPADLQSERDSPCGQVTVGL